MRRSLKAAVGSSDFARREIASALEERSRGDGLPRVRLTGRTIERSVRLSDGRTVFLRYSVETIEVQIGEIATALSFRHAKERKQARIGNDEITIVYRDRHSSNYLLPGFEFGYYDVFAQFGVLLGDITIVVADNECAQAYTSEMYSFEPRCPDEKLQRFIDWDAL